MDRLQAEGKVLADDYYLLRHSIEARAELADATRNNDEAFSEGTVVQVLQHVRQRIEGELKEQIEEESNRRQTAEGIAQAHIVAEASRRGTIREKSMKYAGRFANAARGVVILLLILCTLLSIPWSGPSLPDAVASYAVPLASAILLLFSSYSLKSGSNLDHIFRRIELKLSDLIEARLLDLAGINGEDDGS